jgi:hypothetical protein
MCCKRTHLQSTKPIQKGKEESEKRKRERKKNVNVKRHVC